MKAMLFAAGLGTRLKPFTDHKPKALAEVNGKTLLELNIQYLQRFGIKDVIINVHHFADMIEETIDANNCWGSNITISDERSVVLETGGGMLQAAPYFAGEAAFVVMNVDILTNLDLQRLIDQHTNNNGQATLAVMKRNSSRQLLFDGSMTLCGWQNISTGQERMARTSDTLQPFAFSGIQVVSPEIWEGSPFSGKFSLIDLYLHKAQAGTIKGFDHSGNILIDVGKPESIAQAEMLFG